MSRSWTNGSTRQWRRIRAYILTRDAYQCRAHQDGWCNHNPNPHTCLHLAPLNGPNPGQAHHTHGRKLTGDNPDYLVAACPPCNQHIGDPTTQRPNTTIHLDPAAL